MKAYFEPKMNISVFEKADVVTTSGSGTISNMFTDGSQQSGNNFYKATFNQIYDLPAATSVPADTTIN